MKKQSGNETMLSQVTEVICIHYLANILFQPTIELWKQPSINFPELQGHSGNLEKFAPRENLLYDNRYFTCTHFIVHCV